MSSILIGNPPNIKEIEAKFPSVKGKDNVVFSYYPNIYKRVDAQLPTDLIVHEMTHQRQQKDNPADWWEKYLYNDEFLIEQEIEAYGNQFGMARFAYGTNFAGKLKDQLALSLSSEIYGNIISFKEAEKKIRRYGKAVNKSTLEALVEGVSDTRDDEGGSVRESDEQGVSKSSN